MHVRAILLLLRFKNSSFVIIIFVGKQNKVLADTFIKRLF